MNGLLDGGDEMGDPQMANLNVAHLHPHSRFHEISQPPQPSQPPHPQHTWKTYSLKPWIKGIAQGGALSFFMSDQVMDKWKTAKTTMPTIYPNWPILVLFLILGAATALYILHLLSARYTSYSQKFFNSHPTKQHQRKHKHKQKHKHQQEYEPLVQIPPTSWYLQYKYVILPNLLPPFFRSWIVPLMATTATTSTSSCPFVIHAEFHEQMKRRCGPIYQVHSRKHGQQYTALVIHDGKDQAEQEKQQALAVLPSISTIFYPSLNKDQKLLQSSSTLLDELERNGHVETVLADISMLWIQSERMRSGNVALASGRHDGQGILSRPTVPLQTTIDGASTTTNQDQMPFYLGRALSYKSSAKAIEDKFIWKSFSNRMLKFRFYQIITMMKQHVQSWNPASSPFSSSCSGTKGKGMKSLTLPAFPMSRPISPITPKNITHSALSLVSQFSVHLFCYLLLGSEMDSRRLNVFVEIQHLCWKYMKSCKSGDQCHNADGALESMDHALRLMSRIVREIVKGVVVDEGFSGFSIIEQFIFEEIQSLKKEQAAAGASTASASIATEPYSSMSCCDLRAAARRAKKVEQFVLNEGQRQSIIEAVTIRTMNLWMNISLFISSLTSLLYFLAHDKHVFRRLKSEITEYFPHGRKLRYESIQQMVYLEAIIGESLTQAPPCSTSWIKVLKHSVVDQQRGFVYPKGWIVLSPEMLRTWEAHDQAHRSKHRLGSDRPSEDSDQLFNPDRHLELNKMKNMAILNSAKTAQGSEPTHSAATAYRFSANHPIIKSESLSIFEMSRRRLSGNLALNEHGSPLEASTAYGMRLAPSHVNLNAVAKGCTSGESMPSNETARAAVVTNEKFLGAAAPADLDHEESEETGSRHPSHSAMASSESIFFSDLPERRVSLGRCEGSRAISVSQSAPVNISGSRSFAYQVGKEGFSHYDILSSRMDDLSTMRWSQQKQTLTRQQQAESSLMKAHVSNPLPPSCGDASSKDATDVLMKIFAVVVVRECSDLELISCHTETEPFFFYHPKLRIHR